MPLCASQTLRTQKNISILPENESDRRVHNQTVFVEEISSMSNILRAALVKKGSPAVCVWGKHSCLGMGRVTGKIGVVPNLNPHCYFQNAQTVCTHTVPHIFSCHYTHMHVHAHTYQRPQSEVTWASCFLSVCFFSDVKQKDKVTVFPTSRCTDGVPGMICGRMCVISCHVFRLSSGVTKSVITP